MGNTAKKFLGKLDGDETAIWWVPFYPETTRPEGMFRVIHRPGNTFLCSEGACKIEDGTEEDDFPFLMSLSTAHELFRLLRSSKVRFLHKEAYSDFIVFDGAPRVANSVVETSAEKVLSRQMKELSDQLKANVHADTAEK